MSKHLLDLKRELITLQGMKRKFLSIDKLIEYCDLEHDAAATDETEKQRLHEYQHKMELWRSEIAQDRESVRMLNESSFNALKALVLVSGGSAAAILAFMGSTWDTVPTDVRGSLATGLTFFGSAIVGSVMAYGLTYLTLLCFFELEWRSRGLWVRRVTICLVIACYGSLIAGLVSCYCALQ